MLERFKRRQDPGSGGTAVADRPAETSTATADTATQRPAPEREGAAAGAPATPADTAATRDDATTTRTAAAGATPGPSAMARARERQREAYGGINWGAAFFGWLVAVGMAVLLTGLLGAAGAAIGLTGVSGAEVADETDTLTLGGAIALLVVLIAAYACGGYVSGRMSRFDGARQGVAAWVIGLLITIVIALVALVAGADYNVVERANLPRLPVGDETLSAGGAIATVVILLGTLLGAAAGGKTGERYHRKVDQAGLPG
jgi:hypothetical protein